MAESTSSAAPMATSFTPQHQEATSASAAATTTAPDTTTPPRHTDSQQVNRQVLGNDDDDDAAAAGSEAARTTKADDDALEVRSLASGNTDDGFELSFELNSEKYESSITPSIMEYRQLHGRTYANGKTGDYWGPNDERHSEGLDLIHNSLTMLLDDKLFLAPLNVENPGRVLDIGTGTGIWAMDFADEFPTAEVYGTDLSPIQPTWVPPNLVFEVDDCLLDWTWPENHFDFVHARALYGCIPDWTELDSRILRHLKPGGWFEHVDIGCQGLSDHVEIPPDHAFNIWAQSFYEAGEKMGKPFTICLPGKMKQHMEEAGFVDIVERKFKLPVAGWAKDPRLRRAGLLFQHAMENDMEGFSLFSLTQMLGWTKNEVLVLVAKMRHALRDRALCPYITAIVVYGRKPLEE